MAESANSKNKSTVRSRARKRGVGTKFIVRSVQSRARAFRTLGVRI